MAAFEQRYRQPHLQLTYGIADGRGYAVQFLGGGAKAAVSGDSIDNFKRVFRPHFLPAKFLNSSDKY
jgi:hypothetical protein